VRGVVDHRGRLDAAIAARATGWTLARMPVLDLNVLRLGAFELAERPDVPVAVVIDEAVELAKRFSTDNSGRFVNGVLSALVADLRPPAGEPTAAPS
jgi:N utilization substance protein B